MSSLAAELRRREAAQRREERESRKRQKDLERRIKDRARLSELEQSRLEVEVYENTVDELLSVHKEQSPPIDWAKYAVALPPPDPPRFGRHEFNAVLKHGHNPLDPAMDSSGSAAEGARLLDAQEHRGAQEAHAKKLAEWMRMRALAKGVLTGQATAYREAISEFSALGEMGVLGSSIRIVVHSPRLIECQLGVKGREVIPTEVKSLMASGKLSVKPMPKLRTHEIYQDYVCGCVLRLTREMFALLPVTELLVTAFVKGIDVRVGKESDLPVLSVAFTRPSVEQLNFEQLDPSDSMENFVHRGDAKTSRKSGEFVPIVPLTPEDLAPSRPERMDFSSLLKKVRELRAEIDSKIKPITVDAAENGSDLLPAL